MWRCIVLALVIVGLVAQPAAAALPNPSRVALATPVRRAQATTISADITANTTWTESGSPFTVIADITIQPSAVLTIEPGVQVIFSAGTGLTAIGDLVAIGTSVKGITFTGAQQTAGSWKGILVQVLISRES